MKIVEKILGLSAILIMLVGFFIRFNFMSIAIALVLLLLSMIYFGFSFALLNTIRLRHIFKSESYKGISALRIIGSILVGFVYSILCIGILFKFQLWPNGNYTLLIGLICLSFLVLISVIKLITGKNKFYKNLLIRTLIIGIVGLCFYSMSYETILELRYRNYPEYVEAEKQLWQDPENPELRQKASEERQKMHED